MSRCWHAKMDENVPSRALNPPTNVKANKATAQYDDDHLAKKDKMW